MDLFEYVKKLEKDIVGINLCYNYSLTNENSLEISRKVESIPLIGGIAWMLFAEAFDDRTGLKINSIHQMALIPTQNIILKITMKTILDDSIVSIQLGDWRGYKDSLKQQIKIERRC